MRLTKSSCFESQAHGRIHGILSKTIFTVGSTHKCTIVNKNDKGAILELPYGLEGFCSVKNLAKADGSEEQKSRRRARTFKVLEFSKDDRRIALSLAATWSSE